MRVALAALFFFGDNWANSDFNFQNLHAIIGTFVKKKNEGESYGED